MPEGSIEVSILSGGIIQCRGVGIITHAAVTAAHADIAALLSIHDGRFALLRDALSTDSIESGTGIRMVQVTRRFAHRFTAAAMVTSNGTIAGLGATFHYLIPSLPTRVFTTRADALDWLTSRRVVSAVG